MAAIRRQWFFIIKVKIGDSKFTWRHTSDLHDYGDAVSEMVDNMTRKFGHGFEFEFENTIVHYG